MEKIDFLLYESPLVEVIEVEVEQGFAQTQPDIETGEAGGSAPDWEWG